jgi:UTP--glucose-1-phosphate uridylyltransferase
LVNRYHATGVSTVAVMEVPIEDTSKYGIVEGEVTTEAGHSIVSVKNVIEKPARGQTTSRFALPGRYVFDAEIFEHIRNTKPGKLGEIQLTDAMIAIAKSKGLRATTFEARRFDAGDKLGYLMATIEMGLEHPELSTSLRTYLKGLAARL